MKDNDIFMGRDKRAVLRLLLIYNNINFFDNEKDWYIPILILLRLQNYKTSQTLK